MERSNLLLVVLIRVTGMIPDRITETTRIEVLFSYRKYNNLFVQEKKPTSNTHFRVLKVRVFGTRKWPMPYVNLAFLNSRVNLSSV